MDKKIILYGGNFYFLKDISFVSFYTKDTDAYVKLEPSIGHPWHDLKLVFGSAEKAKRVEDILKSDFRSFVLGAGSSLFDLDYLYKLYNEKIGRDGKSKDV